MRSSSSSSSSFPLDTLGPINGLFIAKMMGLSALAISLATYLAVKNHHPFFNSAQTVHTQTDDTENAVDKHYPSFNSAQTVHIQTDIAENAVNKHPPSFNSSQTVHTKTDSAFSTLEPEEEGVPEKAKDHVLEQEIREINIAIDDQIEGYKMAVNEILLIKISNKGGKNQHFPDYFEYLPDKFNQHFITGRNIVRETSMMMMVSTNMIVVGHSSLGGGGIHLPARLAIYKQRLHTYIICILTDIMIMTLREFVALYLMREHSIINLDRSNTVDWFINCFQMNCQALESMDVDCTEVHNAIKDVQDAADRLHRVAIEKQLAFFTQEEGSASINDNLKHYIHGLRLFLNNSPDESMDVFEERFKKASSAHQATNTIRHPPFTMIMSAYTSITSSPGAPEGSGLPRRSCTPPRCATRTARARPCWFGSGQT